MKDIVLIETKNNVVVSSKDIARNFDKRHDNVLRAIENLQKSLLKNEEQINKYFLKKTSYNAQEYLCTRDGFTLLAMGFTGEKALSWKIKYINEFNRMEEFIKERQSTEWLETRNNGKKMRRKTTDAIQILIPYAENQGSKNMKDRAYSTYTNLVHKLVGIQKGERNNSSAKILMQIGFLEDVFTNIILGEMKQGTYYKVIYQKCKERGQQIMEYANIESSFGGEVIE